MPSRVGDLSTELGIYVTAIDKVFHKVNEEYRIKYPTLGVEIDAVLAVFDHLCITNADHVLMQMGEIIKYFGSTLIVCKFQNCPQDDMHNFLGELITDLGEAPNAVMEKGVSEGKIPFQSMN